MTSTFDASVSVLAELRARYPETPFLALGQTIWWDEPMKAVLRRTLDQQGLSGKMVLGVHDTDYFAKHPGRKGSGAQFALLPHNDGTTRHLWSAAGEISRLFGSETVPTRADYIAHGVPFDRLARAQKDERQAWTDTVTEAWGWRGLVSTEARNRIVNHLKLSQVQNAVEEMLTWGFRGTRESVCDTCCQEEAERLADRLLGWVIDYCAEHPHESLSSLYRTLFPHLMELLLGTTLENTELTTTSDLLRFAPDTASLPRFQFVDYFLQEKTRTLAAHAYNDALEGSDIYRLEKFGLGALPFDVIVPEGGRGTLRVTLRAVHIETPDPLRIPLQKPIGSVQELAEVLFAHFGTSVTLVGKAVALVSMLAREFIFVFNEEGSGYVTRTCRMNDLLRAQGVPVEVHPILRLRYATWDALKKGKATLALPEHLAATFGQKQIPSGDFGDRWRTVVTEQQALLDHLKTRTRPRDLLAFLAEREGGDWVERQTAYETTLAKLHYLHGEATRLQREVQEAYALLAVTRRDIVSTEAKKGDHFRRVQALRQETPWSDAEREERAAFDARLKSLCQGRRELLDRVRALKARRLAWERSAENRTARRQRQEIEQGAAQARLRLVRNALLTVHGLTHTQHRPSAWWIPMVDASGEWFARIAQTTAFYTQALRTEETA